MRRKMLQDCVGRKGLESLARLIFFGFIQAVASFLLLSQVFAFPQSLADLAKKNKKPGDEKKAAVVITDVQLPSKDRVPEVGGNSNHPLIGKYREQVAVRYKRYLEMELELKRAYARGARSEYDRIKERRAQLLAEVAQLAKEAEKDGVPSTEIDKGIDLAIKRFEDSNPGVTVKRSR